MTAIHQFLPTFAGRDAIGMHTLRLQRLLREAGYESDIYARFKHDEVKHAAYDLDDFTQRNPRRDDTWALYHFSIGDPMVDALRGFGIPIALDYHNITETRFFLRWDPAAAITMFDGRRQLASLVTDVNFSLADSSFNESELRELGFNRTAVAPILIDFADLDTPPDPSVARARDQRRAGGGHDWLCVGRIAPNKCQHDVIAAFAAYRRLYDRQARLTLVGGKAAPSYSRALETMCRELGVADAVTFADVVTHEKLLAYYRTSDVFVLLSEHEGFNVPVLEAMHFGMPVVAYAACAVPETVGAGGLLLDEKEPVLVATAVRETLSSEATRSALVAAGRTRVEHFGVANTGPRVLGTIKEMIG
jgi:glycosyltransferase involved in cell wall biosynthesis